MAPLLRGQTESHRDYVFAEGGHEPDLLAIEILPESHNAVIAGYQLKAQLRHQCRESLAKAKMIRTATSKLVYRITGDHEYYDLTTDPEEMTNLYGQPETAAETARLTTILLDHLITSEQNLPFDPHPIA